MSQPKVSVIVPVYNVERFLCECLDSVLAQTLADFELICVNDGSTDSSPAILAAYEEADLRVHVITQDNGGLSAARNAGLEAARGEYVAFLDSDDFALPELLEKTVAAAERTGAEIVIYDYYLLHDNTGELGFYRDQDIYASLDGKVFSLNEAPQMAQFIGVWDRLFRRDFIERHHFRFPVGRLYEDVTFCAESEAAAERMTLLADHLMYYRRSVAGSITSNETAGLKNKQDFLYVQEYAQRVFREAGVSDDVWGYYAGYFFDYAYMHQEGCRDWKLFRDFFQGVRKLAYPKLFEVAHGGKRVKLYRRFLRDDSAFGAFIMFSVFRPIGKFMADRAFERHKRELINDGHIDAQGNRLMYPQRPPRAEGVSLDGILPSRES